MITAIRSVIASFIRIYTGVHTLLPSSLPALPFIIIANHASHLDTMVIWSALPRSIRSRVRPAGAKDYWLSTPLRRWFFTTVLNGVAIERESVSRSNNPIDALATVLRQGDALLIFPEGTRSRTGDLLPFKSGIYHLVQTPGADVPIVPIGLVNLQRIMPKGEVVPVPMLCSLRLGSTIRIAANESKSEFLQRCRDIIQRIITKD